MKSIPIGHVSLESCVDEAQRGNVLVTRNGEPVAIVVGVAGMDKDQIELGANGRFWSLIAERRGQPTVDRQELERRVSEANP